ncbi:prolyl oligopeptidase family serine peptidase [Streptomyces sp. YC504]|uniref:Prolyl oligopeptidase family serine peptidase n=1 Tax=Streptomyces mesophilus TaxID=1775132 RepID=A0A6G4XUL1_9ACTN|nr:PHB depolymerase family esterase [Streptomyces mesophilus]NGO80384.1 prolyl oligopeptidase family serine peptidase [Streptomyces mesophilus]
MGAGLLGILLATVPAALASPPTGAGTPVTSRCAGDAGHGTLTRQVTTNALGSMTFYVYVPDSVRARPGVVVHLHGANDDARDVMCRSRLNEVAWREGFIAVYPQEDPDNGAQGIWDWGGSAYAGREGRAPSLLAGLTRQAVATHGADPRQVFVSGISAGGAMAVVAAATSPDVFRGVAVEVGCMYAGLQCNPTTPYPNSTSDPDVSALEAYRAMGDRARRVPMLVSYGTADPIAALTDQGALVRQWLGTNDWADNGTPDRSVSPTPATIHRGSTDGRTFTRTDWRDARGRLLVQRYAIDGLLHAYSGGAPLSPVDPGADPTGPNMRAVAWEFFSDQVSEKSSRRTH